MYEIIHTKAIVLLDRVEKEYNKIFFLFTEELGLVSVHAISILKPGAKLVSMLQPHSIISCDIVVGKHSKKITTIVEKHPYEHIFLSPHKKQSFLSIFNFIIAMVPRNIPVKDVYALFSDFIYTLETDTHTEESVQQLEVRTLYKILASLGYIDTEYHHMFDTIETDDYPKMYDTVNKVLKEIHT